MATPPAALLAIGEPATEVAVAVCGAIANGDDEVAEAFVAVEVVDPQPATISVAALTAAARASRDRENVNITLLRSNRRRGWA